MKIFLFLTLSLLIGFTFSTWVPTIPSEYDSGYKHYYNEVNFTGITYSEQTVYSGFPCFADGAHCLSAHTNYQTDFSKYSFNALYDTVAKCDKYYTYFYENGKEVITAYTGTCYTSNLGQFLLTCSKGNGELPDHTLGWGIIYFNQTSTEFWGFQGALGRFGSGVFKDVPFVDNGTSSVPSLENQVNMLCSTATI